MSSDESGETPSNTNNADLNYLNTVELLPGADNYLYDAGGTVGARPGMMTISTGGLPAKALAERARLVGEVKENRRKAAELKKFGTCDGVIVRCLLNIWGVIMFLRYVYPFSFFRLRCYCFVVWEKNIIRIKGDTRLTKYGIYLLLLLLLRLFLFVFLSLFFSLSLSPLRMGFVVAHAGIWQASLVVLASLALTVLTATSLSAIATNGEVEGGGAYFLISRSLGAESGGAIGLVFAVANAVSVSMYLIGFSETVVGLYGTVPDPSSNMTGATLDNYMTSRAWDIRIVAFLGLVLITMVACAGANWVVKIDIGQLVVLIIGILAFVVGTFTSTVSYDPTSGIAFTSWNATTFASNWNSDYRPTPINPQGENFMSIFSVFFPAVTGMMAGANISGELRNAQKSLPFGTMVSVVLSNIVYIAIAVILGSTCLRDGGQHGGLFDDSILMIRLAVWPPLVIVGIFASTLSSALATLVGAPRILKAVCDDGLFPPLEYFAKAREKDNEPIRGYFLTGFVAAVGIMIGDLNAIAPLITNFFLATRALINFACFLASYSRSPGWRPSYKMYNKWVSLVTAVLCIAVMFAISWWQALVTLGIGVALYVYIRRAAPEVNWGAAELGYKWSQAKQSLLHLDKVELSHHVKTWRPIFLGVPLDYSKDVKTVVNYTKQLEHANGFTIVADILIGEFHEMYKKSQDRVRARRSGISLREQLSSGRRSKISKSGGGAEGQGEGSGGDGDGESGSSADKSRRGIDGGMKKSTSSTSDKSQGDESSSSGAGPVKQVRFGRVTMNKRMTTDDLFAGGGAAAGGGGAAAEGVELTEKSKGKEEGNEEEETSKKTGASTSGAASGAASIETKGGQGDDKEHEDDEEESVFIGVDRADTMKIISEGVDTDEGVLTETLISPSRLEGVRTMLQTSGVGRMKPNMLMLTTIPDLRNDHAMLRQREEEYTDDMVDMLLSALKFDFGVGLLSSSTSKWGEKWMTPKGSNMMGCFGTRSRYGDEGTLTKVTTGNGPVIDVYWVADTGGW